MIKDPKARRISALERELQIVKYKEKRLAEGAVKTRPAAWKTELEKKIPKKIAEGLESAFAKGFSLVFKQGRAVIEKSYDKNGLREDHAVFDFAFRTKCGRKELHDVKKGAERANLINMTVTTMEGIGLGALGVGMPDIVLFIGMLLRGIYETSLRYGYDYESRYEQLLILKMMAAALSSGDEFTVRHKEIDLLVGALGSDISEEELEAQIKDTASVFAVDMLLLKFIQGLPVVGMIGGAANPIYYGKIMRYVQMQYQKRFLEKLLLEEKTGIRLD